MIAYLNKLIVLLILLVPVTIGALNPTAEVLAVIAFVLSLLALPFIWRQWSGISGTAKTLMLVLVGYFAIGLMGLLQHGFDDPISHHALGTTSHFFIIVPILLVLLVQGVEEKWFWVAVVAGAILNGGYSLFFEPRGSINSVLYGGISIFLGFASLMAWRYFSDSWVMRGLVLLGYMLGVLASFYSQTRGSWVAIPGLLIVVGLYLFLVLPNAKRRLQAFVGVMVLLGAVAAFSFDHISGRVVQAVSEAANYEDTGRYRSSVGYRLEVYKGALEVYKRNPIFGVGLGHEMQAVGELIEEGYIEDVSYLVNVHNQILQDGVAKGTIGVLSYFGMMLFLLVIFMRGMFKSTRYREVHGVGLLILAGYGVFGLTNITFTHGVFNTFFVCMIALIFSVKGILADYDRSISSSSK